MTDPKCILITGASSGIGAALAEVYATSGVRLCLMGRNKERLENVAQTCRAKGADVATAMIDVCDTHAMKQQLEQWDDMAPFDLLVANAGISAGLGAEIMEPLAQIKQVLHTNIDGVINTIVPLQARFIARKAGQIAIISSLAGFRGLPGSPAYSASKAAVRSYGESLHGSLKRQGVDVSVVCPGFIRTPLTDVNPFPMPLLMEPLPAARHIRRKLARKKPRIAFPFFMYAVTRLVEMLPFWLTNRFFARVANKPART